MLLLLGFPRNKLIQHESFWGIRDAQLEYSAEFKPNQT